MNFFLDENASSLSKGLVIVSCDYAFAPRPFFHELSRVAKELRLLILIGHPYCIFSKDVQQNVLKPVTESHLNIFSITGKYNSNL
jgi:hypothetical protein